MLVGKERRYALRRSCSWEGGEVVEPGDEIAADVRDDSHLIASQADREQVLGALKAAFVQGRLTKDEFDQRVGRALATYAELDALTADIPAGPIETQPSAPDRESHNRKVIQRGTAAGAGVSMAFTAASVIVAGGSAVVGAVAVPLVGLFVAVLLAGLLTLLSWALEKGSGRQPLQGRLSGPSGKVSQRPASADSTKSPPQIPHGLEHTVEAARSHPPRSSMRRPRSLQRWRIA
ncbi:MAG: DUF1707 domain-containing protein [Streptosporangiaceae bacterium]